jgi:hypothetical protein
MKAADTDTAAADTAGTDAGGQGTAASAAQAPADIVSLSGMYTYDQMTADLTKLAAAYPDSIRVSTIGATALGRKILEVILGNPKAAHSIMIQSSMHAREYLATQMTMKMIEYYAQQYRSGGTWNGHSIRKLLNTVCLYIVPMSNPDGVFHCAVRQGQRSGGINGNSVVYLTVFGNDWLEGQRQRCRPEPELSDGLDRTYGGHGSLAGRIPGIDPRVRERDKGDDGSGGIPVL